MRVCKLTVIIYKTTNKQCALNVFLFKCLKRSFEEFLHHVQLINTISQTVFDQCVLC